MADHKYTGFFYVEGDKDHGFIDQSISFNEKLPNSNDKITFMKILGRFEDPVSLSYQVTTNGTKDHVDKTVKFLVENSDGKRNEIDPYNNQQLWPHFFQLAKFIYDYFYSNIKFSPNVDKIRTDIEEIFQGSRPHSSDIIRYARESFRSNTLEVIPVIGDPERLGVIRFQTANANGNTENRQFTCYIDPRTFVDDYIPDNPYVHIFYTPDRDISLQDMSDAISKVQSEIAGKVLTHYRKFEATTVIKGAYTTTTFHIWSTRAIPEDKANLLRMKVFRQALQNTIRALEPLSEEELLEKYPEIFVASRRVLYCMSENHTMNDTMVGTSHLLCNPVRFQDIENLLTTDEALKSFVGETIEIFTIEANQIWVPIIAAGGLSDKLPFYRPTIAGLNAFKDKAPEEVKYATVFWRTLVRIINNAYDGIDLNTSIFGTIENGDPLISPPTGQIKFYEFSYKTINWQVYCGKRL